MRWFSSLFIAACAVIMLSPASVFAATYNVADCDDLNDVDNAAPLANTDIVELTADITCDTVLGDAGIPFRATFDGNGFTISRPGALNMSLFSQVDGATIRDLTVSTTFTIISGTRGGLINEVVASSTATNITNVTTTAHITANSGLSTVGGFIGLTNGVLNITSSTFNGSITYTSGGPNRVGAFIGYAQDDSVSNAIVLRGNTISGDITMTGAGLVSKAAGLIGELEEGNVTSTLNTISGDISVSGSSEFRYSGSLIGEMGIDSTYASVSDVVSGTVTSTMGSTISGVGGSVGYFRSGAILTVTGTSFSGAMDLTGPYIHSTAIIGIGQNQGATSTFSNITSSRTGTFRNDGTGVDSISDIGGVHGYFEPEGTTIATIDSVDVSGAVLFTRTDNTVTSTDVGSIGGYIGETYSTSSIVITGGTVSSDITVSIGDHPNVDVDKVGGLVGSSDSGPVSISGTIMSGDLTLDSIATSTGDTYYIGGLIGYLDGSSSRTATISGVTMSGDINWSGNSDVAYIGGLVGYSSMGELQINTTNITGIVTVTSTNDLSSVAGGAGYTYSDIIINNSTCGAVRVSAFDVEAVGGCIGMFEEYDLTLTNVTSTGGIIVTGFKYLETTGGLIGDIYDVDGDVLISGSRNLSDLILTSASTSSIDIDDVGGIIGGESSSDAAYVTVTSTYNAGNITITSNQESSTVDDVGGFFGYFDVDELTVSNSYNAGNITIYVTATSTEADEIGGIQSYISEDIEFTNVYNTGDITIYAAASSTSVTEIGGIYGYVNDYEWEFDDVYSTGDITIYANASLTEVEGIGGLFGYAEEDTYLDIEDSYFNGSIWVDGGYSVVGVGGFIGYVEEASDFVVNRVYAIASTTVSLGQSVQSELKWIGGFIGSLIDTDADDGTITDAFAAGTMLITAVEGNITGDITGIGGFYGQLDSSTTTNTYADVDITINTSNGDAPTMIGGFVGEQVDNGDTTIRNSFAVGRINITADTDGGLVGGFIGSNTSTILINNYFDQYRTGETSCDSSGLSVSGCTGVNPSNYAATTDYFINNSTNAPMSSWNFDSIWETQSDYYPVLAFNSYNGPAVTLGTGSAPSSNNNSGGGSAPPPNPPSVSEANNLTLGPVDPTDGFATTEAFQINGDAAETTSTAVTLTFTDVVDAVEIALSNTSNFNDVSFIPFNTVLSHTLSVGNGIKTVYAKLRSAEGAILNLKESITLVGQGFEQIETPAEAEPVDCSLAVQKAYQVPGQSAVYYVTKDCTKRAFTRSTVYFTYFTSWGDVVPTTAAALATIADDAIPYMPWGPLYNPASGSLVKTFNNPKVYLLLNNALYHIAHEEAATYQFGENWARWVEDVDARLIESKSMSSIVLDTTKRLDGMLIKYPNSEKVYLLQTGELGQEKRWIVDEETFISLSYRWDRIVTIPESEVYVDGVDLTN